MENFNTSPKKTKLSPPYSGILRSVLAKPESWKRFAGTAADGNAISVYLIVGTDAWQKAKSLASKYLFLILSPGDDPAEFDWSLLKGRDPILTLVAGKGLSDEEYDRLASALMRDGVTRFLRSDGTGRATRYLCDAVVW